MVPDPVFSQKMMGEGVAIRPLVQVQPVLAPVSGKVDIKRGGVEDFLRPRPNRFYAIRFLKRLG